MGRNPDRDYTSEVIKLIKSMLKKEGIVFNERDRIDLERYLWDPDRAPHVKMNK
jgi:alkylated DNA nucleotide flippase Atl1